MGDLKTFLVHGPFVVPVDSTGKAIGSLKGFWREVDQRAGIDLSARRGVYVFAIRAGSGFTPIYVGKAAKTRFGYETFASHKRDDHYNPAIASYRKGTPVMFFVMHPPGKGKPNLRMIDEIEGALIALAWKKNSELSNVRRRPNQAWAIRGVLLASAGQPSVGAQELRRVLGL